MSSKTPGRPSGRAIPASCALETHLTIDDLIRLGVVGTRPTLYNWIKDGTFPPGRLLGPSRRAWSVTEVQDWLKKRPVKLKTVSAKSPGRPRKSKTHDMEAHAK